MPKCVATAIGCDWYPRVWWSQLDVIGTLELWLVAVGCGSWHTHVWLWQLDVVGATYMVMTVECV